MPPLRAWKGFHFAAVPTPFDSEGELHLEGLRHLVSSLAASLAEGIAIGKFPGRASRLAPGNWQRLVATSREGLDPGKLLVASVGAAPELRRPLEVFGAARERAIQAAERGADALLAQPPPAVRGRPDRDQLVLEYHAVLAEAGLPLVISYRREVSGGIAYGPEVLAQLLARPEVVGVEIATIDGITTFQQVEALLREFAPEKLVISGEERFLGYSLMSGADAAMVGIGAAYPELVRELLQTHTSADASSFLKRSAEVDALARPIFRAPLDGSNLRLLRTLGELGKIPPEAVHEPH
jgi:4-hydroxy-tetrahydrodipicolinate synthase